MGRLPEPHAGADSMSTFQQQLERAQPAEVRDVLDLIRRAQRASFMASHFEELRGLLASWRYLHRWVALLMVLLLIVHVLNAVRFGDLGFGGAP